jgi:hypothetical protein
LAADQGGGAPTACGDLNADGRVDVTDAIHLLEWLFRAGPDPTCEPPSPCGDADPFDAGAAELHFKETVNVTFSLLQSTHPNLWDLTYFEDELWAIVVSGDVDEVASLERNGDQGTFVSRFVTSGEVGTGLADDESQLFVDAYACPELGTKTCIHVYDAFGVKVGELPQVLTGGERGMASIGDTLWQLGVVDGECFGIFSTSLLAPNEHTKVCLPNLPDFLTASSNALITVEGANHRCKDFAVAMRTFRPDGTPLQDFVLPLPATASEVTGIAYDAKNRILAVGDRGSSQIHFFDVVCCPACPRAR